MRGALAILTGPSGSGKTTLCRELATAVRRAGRDVAGVLSPADLEASRKVGIVAVDLRSGEARVLARPREGAAETAVALCSWAFDAAVLAWANERLAHATPCDLLVVDELGPLELDQGRGWSAGLAAIDSADYGAALVVVRPGLLERARARWPAAAVIDVTEPGARERTGAFLAADSGRRDPR